MARSRLNVTGTGLALNIEAEGVEQTAQVFKDVRSKLGRELRAVIQHAAEEAAVPPARRRAGNLSVEGIRVGSTLVVRKGLSNSVYMTSTLRGKKGRVVGLFEYGGTVRGKIVPKGKRKRAGGHAAAIMTPFGPRASVSGPRHYKGLFFMTKAVDEHRGEIAEEIEKQVVGWFGPMAERR